MNVYIASCAAFCMIMEHCLSRPHGGGSTHEESPPAGPHLCNTQCTGCAVGHLVLQGDEVVHYQDL